ncbi:MarR family winged helix-turn-helix transcriptional regulator [Kiloniella sp. EL199]|uniref:MarR family winged helix-turn-helix transcriptional regulator n=1 Tax=Kiloniella sp. EL199 TaxID=2107581 RepID=UPI000EA17449|nr:MarR family winged helix-turn-helix transcriptional regulator [Kiloniella sp. EL199]
MQMHIYVKLDAIAATCHCCQMTHIPTQEIMKIWGRIFRIQKKALAYTENALKAEQLPRLSWYDILLELDKAGNNGLRPFEIERNLLLPQYGLSRLLDRIEKNGYLQRIPCEEDGRGHRIVITKKGRDTRLRMWPIYAKAIQDIIGSGLSENDLGTLSKLLIKINVPDH